MKKLFAKLRGDFQENHPLANYTTWKIGGLAEYFYQPADLEDLSMFLRNWKKEPVIFLGAGSNVLIRDGGVKGVVIYLRGRLNNLRELDDFTFRVEAGVGLARLVQQAVHFGMIDAAFLAGIPGTVGGALVMNAGAFGDAIWNHVTQVEVIDRSGKVTIRQAAEFEPHYRRVIGLKENEWFVASQLNFARGDVHEAENKLREVLLQRKCTQPVNEPSCGSVFRNPANNHAGKLIEACGLKGMQIGGAKISEKHANFIVNVGEAKAADVEKLMGIIVSKVLEKYNINLVSEVKIIGEPET